MLSFKARLSKSKQVGKKMKRLKDTNNICWLTENDLKMSVEFFYLKSFINN